MSLIYQGRLVVHDIYKTAKLNERESVLVKGRVEDGFPLIIPNNPFDGAGVLQNCDMAFTNGDQLTNDQWNSLQLCHAGISCQLLLKPKQKQGILFDIEDNNFLAEFNDLSRRQNVNNETNDRIFLCYVLRRGSLIPANIAIEQDGENHVCLYPIGNNIPISAIEPGLARFTIDQLLPLQPYWTPYAIFQVRGGGFNWPLQFPPDSDMFPFRSWITTVVNYGESDIAVMASVCSEEFVIGELALVEYLSKMLNIAKGFALSCEFKHLVMNVCIMKALQFALNVNLLHTKSQR